MGKFSKFIVKYSFIIFIFLATICTAVGQLLLKIGSQHLSVSYSMVYSIVTNVYLMSGVVLYCLGAIFLLYSLKKRNLSYTYPFMSLNFMWVSILSFVVLDEKLFLMQIIGILVIITGVVLIGSDKEPNTKRGKK